LQAFQCSLNKMPTNYGRADHYAPIMATVYTIGMIKRAAVKLRKSNKSYRHLPQDKPLHPW
jgi:hypothetical protein